MLVNIWMEHQRSSWRYIRGFRTCIWLWIWRLCPLRQTKTYIIITYWKLHSLTHSLTLSLSLSLFLSVSTYVYIYINIYMFMHVLYAYVYIYIYICTRVVCVCLCMWNVWTDLKPSRAAYIIINILSQGITGVPGGSVINADTSPGPV